MKRLIGLSGLFIFLFMVSIFPHCCSAQEPRLPGDPIVIQVIHLDYADAEYLASVLQPLLSREGTVVAYKPTNSLIIKERASLVKRLVEIIKGVTDH
jgi:type II secretory pathway component GspD/PulD (secretin)